MRDRRTMTFGILVMLLIGSLVVVGCGSTPTPTPEPTPELPSVSSSSLEAVCAGDGTGVPEVAPYTQTSGIHPIKYAVDKGSGFSITSFYSTNAEWEPVKREDRAKTELMACIAQTEMQIEQCPYTVPPAGLKATVTRVQVVAVVTLYEAQTGKQVAISPIMEGDPPRKCEESESFPQNEYSKTLTGARPEDDVNAWLKQYVEVP